MKKKLFVFFVIALFFMPGVIWASDSSLLTLNYLLKQKSLSSNDVVKKFVGMKQVFRPDLQCCETLKVYEVWCRRDGCLTQPLRYSYSPNVGKFVYVVEKIQKKRVNECEIIQCLENFLVKETVTADACYYAKGFRYLIRK